MLSDVISFTFSEGVSYFCRDICPQHLLVALKEKSVGSPAPDFLTPHQTFSKGELLHPDEPISIRFTSGPQQSNEGLIIARDRGV